MVQIKHFTAPLKMPSFRFSRRANWQWRDKILSAPQRGQNIIVNQSKPILVTVFQAFHLPEFQSKLLFTRNWVGGFYWDCLLKSKFMHKKVRFKWSFFLSDKLKKRQLSSVQDMCNLFPYIKMFCPTSKPLPQFLLTWFSHAPPRWNSSYYDVWA